jgi:hypothetical protein
MIVYLNSEKLGPPGEMMVDVSMAGWINVKFDFISSSQAFMNLTGTICEVSFDGVNIAEELAVDELVTQLNQERTECWVRRQSGDGDGPLYIRVFAK